MEHFVNKERAYIYSSSLAYTKFFDVLYANVLQRTENDILPLRWANELQR